MTFGALRITPATLCVLVRDRIIATCSDIVPPQYVYITDESGGTFTPDFSASNRIAVAVCWPSVSDSNWQYYSVHAVQSVMTVKMYHRLMVDPQPRRPQMVADTGLGWTHYAYRILRALTQWTPVDSSGNCYFIQPSEGLGYNKAYSEKPDQYNEIHINCSFLYLHPE